MFGTLIASFATGEIMSRIQRLKQALLAYTVAGALLAIGIVFLIVAGTIWLSERYGAVKATLCIGGGFILLAVIVVAAFKLGAGSKTKVRRRERARNNDMKKAAIATGIALLPTLLSGRGGKAVLLAPLVGALAYALYKENAPRTRKRRGGDEDE